MKVSLRILLIIVMASGFIFMPVVTAQAAPASATITVTNNADSGPGSLRDAIYSAAEGDTITFAGDYTITLASQLEIGKQITISGAGHHITLDGNHAVRVFHVYDNNYSQKTPTFDHLNIINGKITGDDCAGSMAACGGGMLLEYLSGAIITNCTFSGNDGGLSGGAIYSYYGLVTVTNSTFVGNTTTAYAGAIQTFYGNLTLINNTFFGNITGGYGSAVLNSFGTVTFKNNIIVKTSGPNACDNSVGTFNDQGGNLGWGDASCFGVHANPMLGTLGDYGGDTPTMPLLPGSAALDLVTSGCLPFDQRGVARAATCDPGAFESNGFTLSKTGGDSQLASINTAFAAPLALSVAANTPGDPVDGGQVVFSAPSTGASASLTGTPATISGGAVSVIATANDTIGGPYTVTASAAGAPSISYSLTNTPDTVITTTPANPSGSSDASFGFEADLGSGGGTASFECALDGANFSVCTSPKEFTGLADGSHSFQARAVDTLGNKDATPASYTWVVDTIEPHSSISSGPSNPSASTTPSFVITGSDVGGSGIASFECALDEGAYGACSNPKTYFGVLDGSHTFHLRAIDNAGNVEVIPTNYSWVVDATQPDTTITGHPGDFSSGSVWFRFSGIDGSGTGVAGFECALDGAAFTACTSPQHYGGLAVGSHTFQVRAVDAVGNKDNSPADFTWVVTHCYYLPLS